jgi:hypothetical protein
MFSSATHEIRRSARVCLAITVLSAGLATGVSSAQATTWGHLRSPFSAESQLRERCDFAAEEREELRNGRNVSFVEAGYRYRLSAVTPSPARRR